MRPDGIFSPGFPSPGMTMRLVRGIGASPLLERNH